MSELSPHLREVQHLSIGLYVNGGFESCSRYIDELSVEAEAIGVITNEASKLVDPVVDMRNKGEISKEEAAQVLKMIIGLNDERRVSIKRERHAKIMLKQLVGTVIIDPNHNRA